MILSTKKPSDFLLLFEAFRIGLICGFVSKEEIIMWADEIIKQENEPDYFFIELSLAHDTNTVLTLLSDYAADPENPVPIRAAMGLAYQRSGSEDAIIDAVIKVTGQMSYYEILTPYEVAYICDLDYVEGSFYDLYSQDAISEMIALLFVYKDFRLDNYDQWNEINIRVEAKLSILTANAAKKAETDKLAYQLDEKRRLQRILYLRLALYLMALITLIFIISNYKFILNGGPATKFSRDFYQFSVLYFFFFAAFHFLKGVYWLIMKAMGIVKR